MPKFIMGSNPKQSKILQSVVRPNFFFPKCYMDGTLGESLSQGKPLGKTKVHRNKTRKERIKKTKVKS